MTLKIGKFMTLTDHIRWKWANIEMHNKGIETWLAQQINIYSEMWNSRG